jgi:hypothetical protein
MNITVVANNSPVGSRISGRVIFVDETLMMVHSIIIVFVFIRNHRVVGSIMMVVDHRARLASLEMFSFVIMTQSG